MKIQKFNIFPSLLYYFEGCFLKEFLIYLDMYDKNSDTYITINYKFNDKITKIINIENTELKTLIKLNLFENKNIVKAYLNAKLKTIKIKKEKIIENYNKFNSKKTILLVGEPHETNKMQIDGYNIIESYYFDEVKLLNNTNEIFSNKTEKLYIGAIIEAYEKVDYIISLYNFDETINNKYKIIKKKEFTKKNIDNYLKK